MSTEKHVAGDSSPESRENAVSNDHVEALAHERSYDDPSYQDHRADDDRADNAKGRNADKFERKYWLSVNYIGTLSAIGIAFMGGIGGYGLIAPVLSQINEDLGPSPNILWVPLVNLSSGAVFFLLVGQLSDIFGRRWFFIIGSGVALIGSIIGAVAKDVNTLIVAQLILLHSPLHRKKLAKELLIHFDWIGVILFSGSLCIFIFGLNWGGNLYAWNSAPILATTILGGITLFFVLPAYEIFVMKRGKEPYLPLHLFTNVRFMSAGWNTGIAASVYYGAAIVFPQVVNNLYYATGKISAYDVGTYAGLLNMAFVFAQVCHGFVVWATKGPKWAMIGSAIIALPLLSAASYDLSNKNLTIGLLIPGAYAMGLVESVSITTSMFPLRSQEEIAQGGGLSGSLRNFTSAIAVAIYTTTLSNRLSTTIPHNVFPVARRLGLPESSMASLLAALKGSGSFTSVKGLTPKIQAAIQPAYREAFKNAASTVFLVLLAFSGTALILSFFTTNNDKATEDYVAGGLHQKVEEKEYKEQFTQYRRASLSASMNEQMERDAKK